jgi:AcrR family transcriptional regulator
MARDRRILDEAAKLFAERGFGNVGVDEIGRRSGVTGPAIYRHFGGKDAILAALFDEALDGLVEASRGVFDDPREALRHRARSHVARLIEDKHLGDVILREDRALSDPYRHQIRQRTSAYIDEWVACVRESFPDLEDDQAVMAAWAVLGAVNSVTHWPDPALARPEVPDALADFVLTALDRLAAKRRGQPDQ